MLSLRQYFWHAVAEVFKELVSQRTDMWDSFAISVEL